MSDDIRKKIERDTVKLGNKVDATVHIKSERITIRLSVEEAEAIDRECKELGVGRSTVIRMMIRQALGLSSVTVWRRDEAAGSDVDRTRQTDDAYSDGSSDRVVLKRSRARRYKSTGI